MKARLLTVRRLTGGSTRRLMEVGSWQLADAKQITGTDEWSDAVDSILSVYFAGDTCSIPLQFCAAY